MTVEEIMALADGYAIGLNAIEFPDYRKERRAALESKSPPWDKDIGREWDR